MQYDCNRICQIVSMTVCQNSNKFKMNLWEKQRIYYAFDGAENVRLSQNVRVAFVRVRDKKFSI